jgi:DNA-binding NarL/FixJ family response regulator
MAAFTPDAQTARWLWDLAEETPALRLLSVCRTPLELADVADEHRPDVALLDAGGEAVELATAARELCASAGPEHPATPVVVARLEMCRGSASATRGLVGVLVSEALG